jgi:16S rRNA (adenine1518-N6/adenine1519-N6)-dimethyltransferase
LARRHGIRPKKSLGQNFLIEPALARRIAELAEVGPGDRVVEVGPGLGSLTVALADTGAEVVAVEVDRFLVPALEETLDGRSNVRIHVADAVLVEWGDLLGGGPWVMVANLPYNVAVPIVMRALDEVPGITRFLVMVQREVGERLAARPGDPDYGGVSVRVAYHCHAEVIRRVAPTVFWPKPAVDSVLVSLVRRPPPADVDEDALWRVVRESFAQRRKTLRNAVIRLGVSPGDAERLLEEAGIRGSTRAEQLDLGAFVRLTNVLGDVAKLGPHRGGPAHRSTARGRRERRP